MSPKEKSLVAEIERSRPRKCSLYQKKGEPISKETLVGIFIAIIFFVWIICAYNIDKFADKFHFIF